MQFCMFNSSSGWGFCFGHAPMASLCPSSASGALLSDRIRLTEVILSLKFSIWDASREDLLLMFTA